MNASKLAKIAVLCIVLCLVIGLFVDQVHAQRAKSGDRDLASKQGLDSLKGSKDSGNNKPTATRTQMMIGIGSIFVMIIVVKWL